ncbi:sulfurtransferase TusA family protein [Pseudooceanicola nitratireducens]
MAMDDVDLNAVDLDARGLICPLPVLRLRKRLMPLAAGDAFSMLTDDPVAAIDIPHFCAEEGHEVLVNRVQDDARLFVLRKG